MASTDLARTPDPPYWVVTFTSRRTDADPDGYAAAAERMATLARQQPGFLGMDSVRGADGVGITLAYFASEQAIREWKALAEHVAAQHQGRALWYADYAVRVARVERAYTLATSPREALG